MIKLIADSSCDMQVLTDVDFTAVPLTISTDTESFVDDCELNVSAMLDVLTEHKGRSYTACPSIDSFLNAFEGADEIYVATMSSGLSGTYNAATAARDIYLQTHPDVKIQVFDTLSTGPELWMLVEKLAELKAQGLPFKQVCRQGAAYLQRTKILFVLQSLHNLAQNGRISKVVASAVGVLGIRIIGGASSEGTIEPIGKCRGSKKVTEKLLEQMMRMGFAGGKVRISHVENEAAAKELRQALLSCQPKADIQVYKAGGLCSYYAERGGLIIGFETGC